jgi:broad specificity phosphatase PhoE
MNLVRLYHRPPREVPLRYASRVEGCKFSVTIGRVTELWLVRHGQTDWNLEGRYQGQSDIPLNQTGLDQARRLARKLDGQEFTAIFSSDLQRARQTAEILAEKTGVGVILDPRLREICQGEWEGKKLEEVKKMQMEDAVNDPIHFHAPGGESVGIVSERLAKAADDIAHDFPRGKVLVVSHGLALATLICAARAVPIAEVYKVIPDNASPEIIEWV